MPDDMLEDAIAISRQQKLYGSEACLRSSGSRLEKAGRRASSDRQKLVKSG
jgi:hypothetical protein